MTCLVIEQMTYRSDGVQNKRRDLWAIDQMVTRSNDYRTNDHRTNDHRTNGHRSDVVAPNQTQAELVVNLQSI